MINNDKLVYVHLILPQMIVVLNMVHYHVYFMKLLLKLKWALSICFWVSITFNYENLTRHHYSNVICLFTQV